MKEIKPSLKFLIVFISLFSLLYFFNIIYFGFTLPGNHYSAYLDQHLNYIRYFRHLLLELTSLLLRIFGFTSITNDYELLVAGHGKIRLDYSCLGLGLMSFFIAFVIAYPRPLKGKIIFLISGILSIQILNIVRFVYLVLYWDKKNETVIDHHTLFNIVIYVILGIVLYFWIKRNDTKPLSDAKI